MLTEISLGYYKTIEVGGRGGGEMYAEYVPYHS